MVRKVVKLGWKWTKNKSENSVQWQWPGKTPVLLWLSGPVGCCQRHIHQIPGFHACRYFYLHYYYYILWAIKLFLNQMQAIHSNIAQCDSSGTQPRFRGAVNVCWAAVSMLWVRGVCLWDWHTVGHHSSHSIPQQIDRFADEHSTQEIGLTSVDNAR